MLRHLGAFGKKRKRELPFSIASLFASAQGAWYDPSSLWGASDHLPRRNLLTSTATLATQTKTVTAVSHTLYIKGTGSVTLSGAATGTLNGTGASDRVSLVFTPTAGSLTLTVSGTVTEGHLTTTATTDRSYQAVTDWTTELYAHAASKNVPWLRRNLLTYTEDFSQSQWQKSSVSITSSGITPPTGKTTAWKVTHAGTSGDLYGPGATGSISVVAGQYYSAKFAVKYFDTAWVRLGIILPGSSSALCWVNTQTGSLGSAATAAGTASDPTQSITALNDGWYEVTLTVKVGTAGNTGYIQINLASADGSGTRVAGSYLTTAWCLSVGTTTYQPIGASWEAQYAANAAAAGVVPTLYTDSAGTTPVTGPDSVIGFLGDLAQGYSPIGQNLVSNGDGSSLTGWSDFGVSTSSLSGGRIVVTSSSANGTNGTRQVVTGLTAGKSYLVSALLTDVTGSASSQPSVRWANGDVTTGFSILSGLVVAESSVTDYPVSGVIVPSGTSITIALVSGGLGVASVFAYDNVSVRELPGYHAIQSGATGLKPTLRLNPNGYWWIQRDLSDDALVTTFPVVLDQAQLGPELVTNGDFSSGSTGWPAYPANTTFSNGSVSFSASTGLLYQSTGLTQGKTYVATFTITSYTSGSIQVATGASLSQRLTSRGSVATFSETFVKTDSNVSLGFYCNAFTGTVDNFSVREVSATNVAYRAEELATVADTGLLLSGATTVNTPATDYGRIYLSAPSSKDAQIRKWLDGKRGAAAVNLGPELVVNGGFDSDTWWSKDPNCTISGGTGNFNTAIVTNGFARASLLTIGKTYFVTYSITAYTSGSVKLYIGALNGVDRSAPGTYSEFITCSGSTTFGILRASGTAVLSIDNVSVREVL